MPILAMVPDSETAAARSAFGIINSKGKDESAIQSAQDYVSKMSYVAKLNSKEARDQAFREVFLKEYSILFDNVDDVKDYLGDHVSDAPYHWMGSKEVADRISKMASANYMKTGYGKVKKVIDEMPADEVKEYLKKLIEDNIIVGVEIMKGHK